MLTLADAGGKPIEQAELAAILGDRERAIELMQFVGELIVGTANDELQPAPIGVVFVDQDGDYRYAVGTVLQLMGVLQTLRDRESDDGARVACGPFTWGGAWKVIGAGVSMYDLLAMRRALKLEIETGMEMRHGHSLVKASIKRGYATDSTRFRRDAYRQLDDLVVANGGQSVALKSA